MQKYKAIAMAKSLKKSGWADSEIARKVGESGYKSYTGKPPHKSTIFNWLKMTQAQLDALKSREEVCGRVEKAINGDSESKEPLAENGDGSDEANVITAIYGICHMGCLAHEAKVQTITSIVDGYIG